MDRTFLDTYTERLNVRSGAGTAYPVVGTYAQGTVLVTLGADASGGWLQVQTPDGTTTGWVSAALVEIQPALFEPTATP